MSHNYFTSLSISPNINWLIISILILILYEHLISFTQSLRFLCNYASLRNAELVRKEEALYLRFFALELKMRKFAICNGPGRWARSKLIFRMSALCDVGLSVHLCMKSA